MKKNRTLRVLVFGLCVVAALSMLYSSGIREKLISTNAVSVSRELPIHYVDTDQKQLALSFDITSGNENINTILETLANHNVTASFFVTAEWVKKYPDDVKKISSAGHDLGSLGSSYVRMSQLNATQRRDEFTVLHNQIKELTGIEVELFRPPYGDYNNDVILDARAYGYYPILWSIDSLDWRDYGAAAIVKTICEHKNLGNGAIILCRNGATKILRLILPVRLTSPALYDTISPVKVKYNYFILGGHSSVWESA